MTAPHVAQVCSGALASGTVLSRAASPTAGYISTVFMQNRNHMRNSLYLGLGSAVFEDLCEVFEKSQQPGWEGDSAEPVSHDTYLNAWRFLESLPLGIQAPSIGVEPDGHLTLEWYKAPRRTISVSVSPDGFLYYAALIGLRKTNGSEPFFGDVPQSILELVGIIFANE
jgi:hypothetical protein